MELNIAALQEKVVWSYMVWYTDLKLERTKIADLATEIEIESETKCDKKLMQGPHGLTS